MGSHSAGRHSRQTDIVTGGQRRFGPRSEDSGRVDGLRPTTRMSFASVPGDGGPGGIDTVTGPLSRSSTTGVRRPAGGRAAHRAPAARGAGRARLAVAGTASLAGLGAFAVGMALSNSPDSGPAQAFGSADGVTPVEAVSGPVSMEPSPDQASRGERGELPLTSPGVAPLLPGHAATAPDDEPPGVPFGYQPYDYQPYDPPNGGLNSWAVPLAPLAPPALAPPTDGVGSAGAPAASEHFTPPDPGSVLPEPSWLAEPTWLPEPGNSALPPVPDPATAPPAVTKPDTPPAPVAPPAPPAPAPEPSGTSLPFEPILDGATNGLEFFQVAPTPVSSHPSHPSKAHPVPPAAAFPHD